MGVRKEEQIFFLFYKNSMRILYYILFLMSQALLVNNQKLYCDEK